MEYVNAKLTDNWWSSNYKMFEYDSNSNITDSEGHLLELINNPEYIEDGFYRTGDQITLPNGTNITIEGLNNGEYKIIV